MNDNANENLEGQTLTDAAKEYFDISGQHPNLLPAHLHGWVRRVFIPSPFGPGLWSDLTPDERRSAAARWDEANSAASLREHTYWWNLELRISELEGELNEWENMGHGDIPSEAKLRKTEIEILRTQLKELHALRKAPPFAGNSVVCADLPDITGDSEKLPKQPRERAVASITKDQALLAFEAISSRFNLRKAMGDGVTKWVVDARISKGKRGRGGHVSRWDPLYLAIALHEQGYATKAALSRAFLQHAFLAEWRERWLEQESDLL